ncbi:hypothetical protein I2I05_13465 [Hymenobacter sp. BT683]|uniref:Uncharacterized protein n=1 Tax=Hymenobacter jeongseonensis TaxID=2791027 RepID=A0ABS0IJ91_9BACT|nr:hypothetical protein [Hymenobacter jeongseonensis]MBF9238408.1 hypothetical protein [Hymenobacter jeongseonensis]
MKRTLFSLFFTVAIAATASAQSGWDTSDSWGAPKKTTKKKTTTSSGQATGQTRATGNEKTPQNDGRTVSPYPSAAAQPDVNPGNTASTPPDNSFTPGTTSSGSGNGGNDRQGMSVAPGSPMILQSGRTVMANDAAAARERRLNRMNKAKRVPATPTQVNGASMMESQATGAGAGMTAPAASPAAPVAAPAAQSKTAPTKAAPAKPKKKAPAAPSGW